MSWTGSNSTWAGLNDYQRAALMSLMEADGRDPVAAKNALGAMINRSAKGGQPLGQHVSGRIYQPTIEPAQEARIPQLMADPRFKQLTTWAERRAQGLESDPVGGATHFLAPPSTMLALEAREPGKYKNWGPRGQNWTGFDGKQYAGTVGADNSHHFLAPEGKHSVPFAGDLPQGMDPNSGEHQPFVAEKASPSLIAPPPSSPSSPSSMVASAQSTGSATSPFAAAKETTPVTPPAGAGQSKDGGLDALIAANAGGASQAHAKMAQEHMQRLSKIDPAAIFGVKSPFGRA